MAVDWIYLFIFHKISKLPIASCFWTWWRSQPPPKYHPDIRPYCRACKYLSASNQWVDVPKEIVEDLIFASRKAILARCDTLMVVNGCFTIPRQSVKHSSWNWTRNLCCGHTICCTRWSQYPGQRPWKYGRFLGTNEKHLPQGQYISWPYLWRRWHTVCYRLWLGLCNACH